MYMVHEVRRQFREIKGIMEEEAEPEYDKCIDISTKTDIKEIILPGAVTIISPVIVGLTLGPEVFSRFPSKTNSWWRFNGNFSMQC